MFDCGTVKSSTLKVDLFLSDHISLYTEHTLFSLCFAAKTRMAEEARPVPPYQDDRMCASIWLLTFSCRFVRFGAHTVSLPTMVWRRAQMRESVWGSGRGGPWVMLGAPAGRIREQRVHWESLWKQTVHTHAHTRTHAHAHTHTPIHISPYPEHPRSVLLLSRQHIQFGRFSSLALHKNREEVPGDRQTSD